MHINFFRICQCSCIKAVPKICESSSFFLIRGKDSFSPILSFCIILLECSTNYAVFFSYREPFWIICDSQSGLLGVYTALDLLSARDIILHNRILRDNHLFIRWRTVQNRFDIKCLRSEFTEVSTLTQSTFVICWDQFVPVLGISQTVLMHTHKDLILTTILLYSRLIFLL